MAIGYLSQATALRRTAGVLRSSWIVVATFLALLALSVALVASFSNSTRIADELAQSDERVRVAHYLDSAAKRILAAQKLQQTWDDAMRHAVLGDDPVWTRTYLGYFFWGSQRADHVFLVRPDGSLVRGWERGEDAPADRYAGLQPRVARLIARTRGESRDDGDIARWITLEDGKWPVDKRGYPMQRGLYEFSRYQGRPAIMTVAAIIPDSRVDLLRRAPNYVLLVRTMDETLLHELSRAVLLDDMRVSDGPPSADQARNGTPIADPSGQTIGWLDWAARRPGEAIIRRTAPLLSAFMLFFVGVLLGGVMIVRRHMRTTRELVASEAQAQHNAMHDAMSGLPNRVHYMQRLRQELSACINDQRLGDVFVAYLDIDSFKVVNDTLGHHVGDELVRQVAMRLRRALPSTDFLSRFGGDEFVLMRRSPGGRATADELGTQIMDLMREPFLISGNTLEVTCSCGISWGPEQSEDPGELLRRADIALYRAKQRGRARYRRFTRDMDASLKLRREMEMELRRAIARDELSVAFQPIIGLPDGGIHGFEALLRWYHPDRGEIRPGLFVPVAEQAGLMIPLGNWVLRRVFNECQAWPCDISVNLSPLQIMASDFLVTLRTILAETGMDPRRVVLEVTEGVMLDRSEHVFSVLRELNGMGFRIALDDFGIGYSSLSYLRSFQFDRIKIDRSFVQNVEGDVDAHSILCAIVSLGHTLRMKVVAEGVETDVQRQLVQAAGCELVQGHLFWAALAPQDAFALLTRDAEDGATRRLVG